MNFKIKFQEFILNLKNNNNNKKNDDIINKTTS